MSSCPKCGGQMNFVQQYSQWYCNRCNQYQQPTAQAQQQPPAQQYKPLTAPPQPPYQPQQVYQAQQQPAAQQYRQPVAQQPLQNPHAAHQYPPQPAQHPQMAPPPTNTPQQPYGQQPTYQQQGAYQASPSAPQQQPVHRQPASPQPLPPVHPQPQHAVQPPYAPQQPQSQYAAPQGGHQPYQPAFQPQQRLENEISQAPSFSMIVFHLKPGQQVTAEAGAMMYMHNTIDIDTHGRKGGILKGLATSAFGGESFFVNTFTAARGLGDIAFVGPVMGDIKPIELHQGMILQSGAYLASDPQVNLDTKWQGLKGFLTDRDFIMLHALGPGTLWVSSFGAIIEKDLKPGEVLAVDTGHIVAFPDTMQFSVRRIGNWKSTILSGEGLVTDFVGPGRILMQTRHLPAFAEQLLPYLPQQR
ncbi:MAG: TIGR00266 family protein [Methanobacteriota archaeon]